MCAFDPGSEVVFGNRAKVGALTARDVYTVLSSGTGEYGCPYTILRDPNGKSVSAGPTAMADFIPVLGRCSKCAAPLVHGAETEDQTELCTTCFLLNRAEV